MIFNVYVSADHFIFELAVKVGKEQECLERIEVWWGERGERDLPFLLCIHALVVHLCIPTCIYDQKKDCDYEINGIISL